MNGNEVHRWPYVGQPGEVIDPRLIGGQRGHMLLQLTRNGREGIFGNRTVGELNWDGKTVWEWGAQVPGGAVRQNHDWALANGNTLLLIAVRHAVKGLGPKEIGDQGIYEVTTDGTIVWRG